MRAFRKRLGMPFTLVACTVLVTSVSTSLAQPSHGKVPRVGVIFNSIPRSQLEGPTPTSTAALAIQGELVKAGRNPGQNVEVLWRSAESDYSRFPALIDELLQQRVDVIVVGHNALAEEVRKKTRTVPIVMNSGFDLLKSGLISEFAKPGGNVTGVELVPGIEMLMKRLETLRELIPSLARVGMMWVQPKRTRDWGTVMNPRGARNAIWEESANRDVVTLAYQLESIDEIDAAVAAAVRMKAHAMVVEGCPICYQPAVQARIHAAAEKHRIPVMHEWLSGVETGGLIGYGVEPDSNFRRAGHYVARILGGAKAAELPVERLSDFKLYVNRKAATAIGLRLPDSIVVRADKIFE